MKKINKSVVIILTAIVFSFSSSIALCDSFSKPKVLIVNIERLEFSDISNRTTPNIFRLANKNSLGLVAIQKAFAYKNLSSAFYSTISAGSASAGIEGKSLTYADPNKNNFQEMMRFRVKTIDKNNKKENTLAHYGEMVKEIHKKGLLVYAIGISPDDRQNADFLDALADQKGKIDKAVFINKYSHFYESQIISNAYKKSALTFIDYKNSSKNLNNSEKYEIDKLIETIEKMTNKNDLLIVLMPFSKSRLKYGFSGKAIGKGEPLSPVIIKGDPYNGILTSASTRRNGVFIVHDLMPTILKHLKIPTKLNYTGRILTSNDFSGDKVKYLKNISESALYHDAFMEPIIFYWAGSGSLILVLALICLLLGWKDKASNLFTSLIIAIFVFPTAISLVSLFNVKMLWLNIALTTSILFLTVALTAICRNKFWPAVFALAVFPALMIVDLFTGQAIANSSFFGNSLLSGGRYYGLGNQYLGLIFIYIVLTFIFIGLAKPAIIENVSFKIAAGISFFTLILLFGLPGLGANFGALIVLSSSLPWVYYRFISDSKYNWKHLLTFGLLALVFIFSGVIYDVLQRPLSQSHIARSVSLTKASGLIVVLNIVKTKIAHNLEETYLILIKWRVLPVSIVIGSLIYLSRKKLIPTLKEFPLFKRLLPSISLAAILSFFYKDTGFEPFIIILIYTVAAFLYLSFLSETSKEPIG